WLGHGGEVAIGGGARLSSGLSVPSPRRVDGIEVPQSSGLGTWSTIRAVCLECAAKGATPSQLGRAARSGEEGGYGMRALVLVIAVLALTLLGASVALAGVISSVSG